jgi:AcrR family transcriptional regulator
MGWLMARTVKHEEREAKRNAILDATQRLVVTKGYERMTIQDILAELRISSGAFYHYFGSKPEVLDALVDRIKEESGAPLLRIVRDPKLSATRKLRAFFQTLDRMRIERQGMVMELLLVWYADSNAIVRQKVEAATTAWRAPLITEIARQGVREGSFSTPFPNHAGELVLALANAMGTAHAKLMLAFPDSPDEKCFVDQALALHAAFSDAIERVLGAPPGTLQRVDAAAARSWVKAMRDHVTAGASGPRKAR